MIVNLNELKNTVSITVETWVTTANKAVVNINKKAKLLVNRYKKVSGFEEFSIFNTPMRKTSQNGRIYYKAEITLYKGKDYDSMMFLENFQRGLTDLIEPYEVGLK